jgi:hypothetical protein
MTVDISTPSPAAADANAGTSDGAPDGNEPKVETKPVSDTVARAELEKAIKGRDAKAKQAREAEEKLAETNAKLSSLEAELGKISEERRKAEEEAASKNGEWTKVIESQKAREADLLKKLGDTEAALKGELAKVQGERDAANKKFHDNFVRRSLLEELSKPDVSSHPTTSLKYLTDEYEFEAVEDGDGNFQGVRAKGIDKSIADLHGEVIAKYGLDFLPPNTRKAGAGTEPPAGPNAGAAKGQPKLPNNFESLPKDQQVKWMADNPGWKPT